MSIEPELSLEERRLADWLHGVTPEPPHPVSLADIADRTDIADRAGGPGPRRMVRWLPLAAAAAVVVLVASLTWAANRHSSAPPPATSGSSAPTTSRSVAPPGPADDLPVHPWGATTLSSASIAFGTLIVVDGTLYGVANADTAHPRLVSVDPTTGRVDRVTAGTVTVPGERNLVAGAPPAPVATDDYVWYLQGTTASTLTLTGLLRSGAEDDSVTLPSKAQGNGVVLAASGHTLYVGANRTVHLVRGVRPGTRDASFTVDLAITGLAVSPDGTRLYVGTEQGVETRDAETGAVISRAADAGAAVGLLATDGGLWSTAAGGHGASIRFRPAAGRPAPNWPDPGIGSSGGGIDTVATLSGGAIWIGGNGTLACADPDTGAIRASTSYAAANGDAVYIDGVAVSGRAAYATVWFDGTARVVTLTPPAACFG